MACCQASLGQWVSIHGGPASDAVGIRVLGGRVVVFSASGPSAIGDFMAVPNRGHRHAGMPLLQQLGAVLCVAAAVLKIGDGVRRLGHAAQRWCTM